MNRPLDIKNIASARNRAPATALLICSGEPPSRTLARKLARLSDLIVAADGGANSARALGIRPEVIVGDLDSVTPATRRYFASSLFVHVSRQDNTDFEKALDFLKKGSVRDVIVVGAVGRRIDFTLANLSLLWRYVSRFHLTVVGDGWRAIPARRVNRIVSPRGTTVSLIPFGRVNGITLGGLRYPLRDGTLNKGQVAVSNVVIRSPFSVKVRSGSLLIIVQDSLLPSRQDPASPPTTGRRPAGRSSKREV